MDVAHQPRLRERKQVVVAAQLARPVAEARAAVVLFGETRALDHGAHGAVQEEDPFAQQRFECHQSGRLFDARLFSGICNAPAS